MCTLQRIPAPPPGALAGSTGHRHLAFRCPVDVDGPHARAAGSSATPTRCVHRFGVAGGAPAGDVEGDAEVATDGVEAVADALFGDAGDERLVRAGGVVAAGGELGAQGEGEGLLDGQAGVGEDGG
jgi:hypothetical protein